MSTITLDEFREKYCLRCGTQRCGGVTDEPFRDGCAHYQREILKQPTLQDMLSSLRTTQPKYNPVARAYDILTKAHFDDDTDLTGAHIAMEEAIGYLGEALAD